MRKAELFFGYAFVLAGVGLPYLIEHLSGSSTVATYTCASCILLALVLLFLGYRSKGEEEDRAVAVGLFGGEIPSPPPQNGTPVPMDAPNLRVDFGGIQ